MKRMKIATVALAVLGVGIAAGVGPFGPEAADAKPRKFIGKCSTSVSELPDPGVLEFEAVAPSREFEFDFSATCRTRYPAKSFYISEMMLTVLITDDNRSQKILNPIGSDVGEVEVGAKGIGTCSIVGRYRTVTCEREKGSHLGRRFAVSFSLRLNKRLPRGCKDGGSAADIWNAAVTSGRRPDGEQGFTTYMLDDFRFPGCAPRPTGRSTSL